MNLSKSFNELPASKLFTSVDSGRALKQSGIEAKTFFSSLTFSLLIFFLQVIGFCALRCRLRRIYEPRTFMVPKSQRIEPPGPGFFDWIRAIFAADMSSIRIGSGLDAYFFLRYLSVAFKLFAGMGLLVLPILLPLNATSRDPSDTTSVAHGLDRLSWTNIAPKHAIRYTAQFVLVLVFVVIICAVMYHELRLYVDIRQQELRSPEHQSKASATTILVSCLPPECYADEKIVHALSTFPSPVRKVWVNRNYSILRKLIKRRKKLIDQLEHITSGFIRKSLTSASKRANGTGPITNAVWEDIPPAQREKLFNYVDQLSELTGKIEEFQSKDGCFSPASSCFIQFHTQMAAHLACQSNLFGKPQLVYEAHCEVDPRAVIWSNLESVPKSWSKLLKDFAVMLVQLAMIVGWALPVAIVAMVVQVNHLSQLVPFLSWLDRLSTRDQAAISGILSPILIGLLSSVVPYVFRALARLKCLTQTHIELHVQRYLYAFLFIQVFLVVTVTSSIMELVMLIIESPSTVPGVLARDLPKASNFFFSFLLVEALAYSGNILIQISKLSRVAYQHIKWRLFGTTPRQKFAALTMFESWDWGSIYPRFTNLITTTIIYAIISPLVLVFATVAFGLFFLAFKYRIMFCNVTRYESNGRLFPVAIFQIFTGLYFMEICFVGLFLLVRDEHGKAVCYWYALCMVLVMIVTAIYHGYLHREFRTLTQFVAIMQKHKPPSLVEDSESSSSMVTIAFPNIVREEEKATKSSLKRMTAHFLSDDNAQYTTTEQYGSIFDELEADFAQLSPEQKDEFLNRAYEHPALRMMRPCIWVPKDAHGIADTIVFRIRQRHDNINISCADCTIDDTGKIGILRSPPDFDPSTNMAL